MPLFTIKRGGIWRGGKLCTEGQVVELSDEDRELIDPGHTDLQSSADLKSDAAQAEADAKAAKLKLDELAKAEADAKKKGGAK